MNVKDKKIRTRKQEIISKVIRYTLVTIAGVALGYTLSLSRINTIIDKAVKPKDSEIIELERKIIDLEEKVEEAEPWFTLSEERRIREGEAIDKMMRERKEDAENSRSIDKDKPERTQEQKRADLFNDHEFIIKLKSLYMQIEQGGGNLFEADLKWINKDYEKDNNYYALYKIETPEGKIYDFYADTDTKEVYIDLKGNWIEAELVARICMDVINGSDHNFNDNLSVYISRPNTVETVGNKTYVSFIGNVYDRQKRIYLHNKGFTLMVNADSHEKYILDSYRNKHNYYDYLKSL